MARSPWGHGEDCASMGDHTGYWTSPRCWETIHSGIVFSDRTNRGTCMLLSLTKSYKKESNKRTLSCLINMYIAKKVQCLREWCCIHVLPQYTATLQCQRSEAKRLHIALVTSLENKAALNNWSFLAASPCVLFPPSVSSFVPCPHVAAKAAKAVSRHTHSHMASGFGDRAFFDLDLVTGLKALGGGWEREWERERRS